jgi:hypothetical protein
MGSFVPRLLALTVIWLLATAALTFAAAQRISTVHTVTQTTTVAAPAAPKTLVVPDVLHQAYVFAKGTLGDAGFAWRVEGSVQGYAPNTVVSQSPPAGTKVIDTGSPLIVLRLQRTGKQAGVPEQLSAQPGTAVRIADLALAQPAVKAAPKVVAPKAKPKTKTMAKTKAKAPAHKYPQHRPPAFTVAGARREPLTEMPLTDRAELLLAYLNAHPKPTDAVVKHWLYQHAWVVTGAELGWWHGADALRELIKVDQRADALWGIGGRSEAVARRALAEVEARAS